MQPNAPEAAPFHAAAASYAPERAGPPPTLREGPSGFDGPGHRRAIEPAAWARCRWSAARSGILVVADGTSRRRQIKDGTGREALHVARVLEGALG
jgi:hypothetical protein